MKNKYLALMLGMILIAGTSCKKEETEKSSAKEIISFDISGQIGSSSINSEAATITIAVPATVQLDSLAPTITISEKATITPASGEIADFSQGAIIYTVTAEDNSTKAWEVTVTNALSSEADILSFTVNPSSLQSGQTNIGNQDISFQVNYGTDLTAIKATIVVSEFATVSPASDTEVDFSSGSAIYTVTAQDGTEKIWTAHVSYAPNIASDIIAFTVPGQIGSATIVRPNVYINVDYGVDLSSVSPTIEVSEGATITPSSGEAVDFSSGSAQYVVTSEDGLHNRTWTVRLQTPLTPASDAKFQYVGRWDFSAPAKPRAWTPGAYINAKFNGTKCKIAIDDEVLWSTNYNYIVVIIDGTDYHKFQTRGISNTFDISSYLTPGDHTLTIYKATETGMGYIDFKGLYLGAADALLTPDPLPARKIEFIGNSIVVGSNLDLSDGPCSSDPWFFNHNAYYSYGAVIARTLNAQHYITGVSGIGMIHSCCEMTITMPQVYAKTKLRTDGPDWDFDQYIPDVVTISLGQNDGIQDSATFCSAYVSFVETIRSHYPDAKIILLNSPMGDNSLNAVLVEYTNAISDYFNDQGDADVVAFELTHNLNSGCGSHPDLVQHETIATELAAFIQTTMGW